MYIRKSRPEDIDTIMEIMESARVAMRQELHIDQWQDKSYPCREIYLDDMEKGIGYVVCDDDENVICSCAIIYENDPTYDVLYDGNGEFPGKWSGEENKYAAIHRISVKRDTLCRGVASFVIDYVAKKCKEISFSAIRIDTHRGNVPMRRMLEKNGFCATGIIYINEPKHNERITYEKIL